MLRAGVVGPLVWPRTVPSPLGCDYEIFFVGKQGLGDEFFADARAVRISRVDKVDAELTGAAQHRQRACTILGRPPDAVSGDAHRAEAQTIDGEFTAER